MASSDQHNIRSSTRTVFTYGNRSDDIDDEGICSCFFCDLMTSDNMKASYSANKIGLNAVVAKPKSWQLYS